MDALRADDLARARETSPEVKLRQALELMRTGFALKRAALRTRFPNATEAELQQMFERWLMHDD